jgi:hypothetical protein
MPLMLTNDSGPGRLTLLDESTAAFFSPVITVGLFGDVTLDGSVSAFDASMILQSIVGQTDVEANPGLVNELSDVSARLGLTAYDDALVLLHVIGGINEFPVEGLSGTLKAAADAGLDITAGLWTPRMVGDLVAFPVELDRRDGIIAGSARFLLPKSVGDVASARTPEGGLVSFAQDGDVIEVAFADPALASEDGGEIFELLIRPTSGMLSGSVELSRDLLVRSIKTVAQAMNSMPHRQKRPNLVCVPDRVRLRDMVRWA